MKYQDLCIRLREILRARGINTVYFEDVNLLNSEDVIYPAAVVQLVRVEQETQSDRYTIMLTIAGKRQDAKIENETQWINIDKGLTWQNGSIRENGYLSFGTDVRINELQAFGNPNSANQFRFTFNSSVLTWCTIFFYFYETPAVTPAIGSSVYRFNSNGSYVKILQNYTRVNIDHVRGADFEIIRNSITIEQAVPVVRDNTPNIYAIRGITDILAEDEHIQINSCVTTPFRWKFRDECEGITAEINLSLFFDNRCN